MAALKAFFDRHQARAAQYGFFTTTAHGINERQSNPDGGPAAPSAEGLLYIEVFGNASCRAEEERPGREETGRDEDFLEKAKRKLQGQ